MNLTLKQLHHAVVLADTGTYSAAAERLHITQPTLSRSIQTLESRVGARLFDRTPAGVRLTAIGTILVASGRGLIGNVSELEREITLALGLNIGKLRVGAAAYPAVLSIGTACGRLLARHPDLELDIQVGDWLFLTREVLEARIDIAVCELSLAREDDRLVTEALPRHRGHLVVRPQHPLASESELNLEQVLAYPFVASSLPERMWRLKPSIRVDTVDLVRSIVLGSDTVGLVSARDVAAETESGRMVPLDLDLPWLHSDYGFIRLRHRSPSPAETTFMEITREVEQEIVHRHGAPAA